MDCPYCGGESIKNGTRRNKQTWQCKICGKHFQTEKLLKKAVYHPECPYCGTVSYIRGKNKVGEPRYYCPSCLKYFSDKTKVVKGVKCTYCDSSDISTAGETLRGKQLYKCKSCGKRFVLKKDKSQKIFDLKCPKCGHIGARFNGETYNCVVCNHSFITSIKEFSEENVLRLCRENYPITHIARILNVSVGKVRWLIQKNTLEDSKKVTKQIGIITEILAGKSVKQVSKNYGKHILSIEKLMSKYYKHENLTNEQKNMIIRYGIHCKVPIDYLAEYVKCSQYTCKKELEKLNEYLSKLPQYQSKKRRKNIDRETTVLL